MGWSPGSDDGRPERENMNKIKVEWCENFIKKTFAKLPEFANGIEVRCFWEKAEKSGLWERGNFGGPMTDALENLTTIETVRNENGEFLFNAFRLK